MTIRKSMILASYVLGCGAIIAGSSAHFGPGIGACVGGCMLVAFALMASRDGSR